MQLMSIEMGDNCSSSRGGFLESYVESDSCYLIGKGYCGKEISSGGDCLSIGCSPRNRGATAFLPDGNGVNKFQGIPFLSDPGDISCIITSFCGDCHGDSIAHPLVIFRGIRKL